MEERAIGVVLRTRCLTETSLIVHWLTEAAGRVATVARGARRPRSSFRGKLDLFFEAEFTFQRARTSDLHYLREVALRKTFPALRTDWHRLSQAAYGAALLESTTETDTPLPGLWGLFRGFLERVDAGPPSPQIILALELKHLAGLGLLPDLQRESLPPECRAGAVALLTGGWGDDDRSLSGACLRSLSRYLQGFIAYHCDRVPRGRAAALGPLGDPGIQPPSS